MQCHLYMQAVHSFRVEASQFNIQPSLLKRLKHAAAGMVGSWDLQLPGTDILTLHELPWQMTIQYA